MLYGRYISIILLVWIAVLSQLRREKTTAAGGINSATTLLKIQKSATESSVSEPQTENHVAPSLACDDDTIDMIGHHNERGKKRTKQEPTPEPEEDDGDCGEFAETRVLIGVSTKTGTE